MGAVIKKLSHLHYTIQWDNGYTYKRHIDQLRSFNRKRVTFKLNEDQDLNENPSEQPQTENSSEQQHNLDLVFVHLEQHSPDRRIHEAQYRRPRTQQQWQQRVRQHSRDSRILSDLDHSLLQDLNVKDRLLLIWPINEHSYAGENCCDYCSLWSMVFMFALITFLYAMIND